MKNDHKGNINKYQDAEIIQTISSEYKGIKLDIITRIAKNIYRSGNS